MFEADRKSELVAGEQLHIQVYTVHIGTLERLNDSNADFEETNHIVFWKLVC